MDTDTGLVCVADITGYYRQPPVQYKNSQNKKVMDMVSYFLIQNGDYEHIGYEYSKTYLEE